MLVEGEMSFFAKEGNSPSFVQVIVLVDLSALSSS